MAAVPAQESLRSGIDRCLRWSPLQWYYRRHARSRLAVLAYHEIDQPARFARQLDFIRARTHPVSLDEVASAWRDGTPLPPRAVLITFDDGDRTVLDAGLPLLASRDLPAVAFVITDLLDSEQPTWWTEVIWLVEHGGSCDALPAATGPEAVRWLKTCSDHDRREIIDRLRATAVRPCPPQPQLRSRELLELESGAIAVGNHTSTHPCLDRCDDVSVRDEVRQAHDRLSGILGHHPRAFAYPNGNVDLRALEAVDAAGYELAFGFDHRLSDWPPRHPRLVSRVRVNASTPLDRFATILSGLHPAIHALRTRSSHARPAIPQRETIG